MAVLSFGEIPTLKALTQNYGYTLHLHDACGGQSFSLEPMPGQLDDQVYAAIEQFFADRAMTVKFVGKNKLDFIVR